MDNFEVLFKLLLSTVIGGAIGFEREVNNRPAGLRTHILVSVGSTLIMLVSMYGFSEGDPARLAAQVVSGIGFIGAGTILRTGNHVRGLTTAASLWVCAGIGLAIGSGLYLPAIATAIIVLLSLVSLSNIEDKVARKSYRRIQIEAVDRPGIIGDIGTLLGSYYITVKEISINEEDINEYDLENVRENIIGLDLLVQIPENLDYLAVLKKLYEISRIINVVYEGRKILDN